MPSTVRVVTVRHRNCRRPDTRDWARRITDLLRTTDTQETPR